ncbi:coagulation factor IIIa [Gymnodraco acuticeps]|uniref:Tissue factor n=1 Tax=Gymnodraco acuticeps TaxID=8218 RepID=A0A6P8TR08_GYMAC|nr:coagulation factor IIIa [Gymnodraco acuticeps]XP_034066595.1 coagulation factor IIIa [Gymnodraco acuticeps]
MVTIRLPAALFVIFLLTHSASGSYPRAQNVTWRSTNFKTILTWEPKPSANYSYTVEFSAIGRDKERNPHCIRSTATVCDLSASLTDPNVCYTADVLSTPLLRELTELTEFPNTASPRFCPSKDTDIGRPDFKLKVGEDKKKTTLYVSDPITALFKDGHQQTIRDIFSDQLQYKVTYRRNKSTGKKVLYSKSNEIEVKDLDRGESYCFNVQAYIPSRDTDKQLGEMSQTQCSKDDNQSIFEVYSIGVIAAAIFLILLLIGLIIAITVVCIKRRKNALQKEKEEVPLNRV